MRLRSLHIEHFGHFTEHTLDLSGPGVQIIYGPNEAGKSTLLQFVRELLFGYTVQNSYDFLKIKKKLEGSAECVFQDGTVARLNRLKSTSDKLTLTTGTQTRPLTGPEWQALLGGANSDLFQRVFAIGLEDLALGEDLLKMSALQSALVGGTGGQLHPQALIDVFQKESDQLFKDSGRGGGDIHQGVKLFDQLLKESRAAVVKHKDWEDRKQALSEAEAQAQAARQAEEQVRAELRRLQQLKRAQPVWCDAADLQRELDTLLPAPRLGRSAGQEFQSLRKELTEKEPRRSKLLAEHDRLVQALQSASDPSPWLRHQVQIEVLREQIKSVEEAHRDLPSITSQAEQTEQEIATEQRQLVPEWSAAEWEQFALTAQQRHTAAILQQQQQSLAEQFKEADRLEQHCRQQQAALQARWDQLPPQADAAPWQAILDAQVEYVARHKEIERLQTEIEKGDRKAATQRKRLTPPVLPETDLPVAHWPVPSQVAVQGFQIRWQEHQAQIKQAQQRLADAQQREATCERELLALKGNADELPRQEQLLKLRQQRDDGWDLIRWQYIVGREITEAEQLSWLESVHQSGHELPTAFGHVLQQVDRYSDALFEHSAAVVKQAELHRLQQETASLRKQANIAEQQFEQLQADWQGLWQPSQIAPLAPDVMLDWLEKFERLVELLTQQEELGVELQQLVHTQETMRQGWRQAVEMAVDDVTVLFSQAQTRRDEIRDLAQRRESIADQQRQLQLQLTHAQQQRQNVEALQNALQQDWRGWLQAVSWPANWTIEFVENVLPRFDALHNQQRRAAELRSRQAQMIARLSEFEPAVRQLCQELGVACQEGTASQWARQLAEGLKQALSDDHDQRTQQVRRDAIEEELAGLQAEIAQLQQARQQWLQQADVSDDAAFLQEAERASRWARVADELQTKRGELERLREQRPPAEFEQQLSEVALTELTDRIAQLEAQLAQCTAASRTADQQVGSFRKELEAIDGGSRAAELLARLAEQRASVAGAVDRYVPIFLARKLLQGALRRFEEQSQPELLQQASTLFSDLTDGRYLRIEYSLEHASELRVRRCDGESLLPKHLSTGTRELLYLATRLAYVLQYCQQTEPLPLVLDDVLANFDPARACQTLKTLSHVAEHTQVLIFTCHPHLVDLAREVQPPQWEPLTLQSPNTAA